ncbi:hypothetical protein R1sor_010502 [Riccia sorocarpa]|uniref:Uncharacterized protein n=1 Tax=Riccia sorocarpa TaxID=122646 RepID=A0ABD3HZN7_9MARC
MRCFHPPAKPFMLAAAEGKRGWALSKEHRSASGRTGVCTEVVSHLAGCREEERIAIYDIRDSHRRAVRPTIR